MTQPLSFDLPQNLPTLVETLCAKSKQTLLGKLSTLSLADIETNDEEMDALLNVFYALLSAHSNDAMEEDAQKLGPITSAYANDLLQNKELFAAVEKLWTNRASLSAVDQAALEKHYSAFKRGGIDLPAQKQEALRALDAELSQLTPQYAETARKSAKAFSLDLAKADLEGVPEMAQQAALETAQQAGLENTYRMTLDVPSYVPFITYAKRRDLREKIWRAYARRGMDVPHSTQDLTKRIATLRHERAQLLGYATHAHYVLERRMAKTPADVQQFLARMAEKAKPAALRELADLQNFAKKTDGIETLKPWDVAYYGEKLKLARFNFDEEALRPYFPMQAAMQGIFTHIEKLFGVAFKALPTLPVYHEDVTVYQVVDQKTQQELGTLYVDPYPRDEKKQGAWQTTFRERRVLQNGTTGLPLVAVVCNFTKPTAGAPALLSFDEVETLFHEFGHACHSLLTEINWPSISGTSVYWDFVELPSQIMENWLYETETLNLFAKHYQTGEALPAKLIEGLQKARTHMAGWQLYRQIQFGVLDMAWHGQDPSGVADVVAFERSVLDPYALLPYEDGCLSTSFSHLFAGGYSAGYYSYLWAEVLDADAYEAFKENGLYDPATGEKFRRTVLAKGGSIDPDALYRSFRGRDATPDALLKRRGLL